MAVDQSRQAPVQLRHFWPAYRRRSIFLVVSMQVVAVCIVMLALLVVGIISPLKPLFWIITIAILGSVVGMNLVVFWLLTEPLKALSAALTHSSGEQSPLTPPNPNNTRYRRSGLSALIEHIYAVGSDSPSTSENTPASGTPNELKLLESVFSQTPAGVAVCSYDGTVQFANPAAPVTQDEGGAKKLDLLFYTEQTFQDWLAACEKKEVRASKTWLHVGDKPPGSENRRVFDVVASYQKGSDYPVIVLFLDKSNDYRPEDDQLNFISFAAHELRGPITVIRGYLDTLVDEMGSTVTAEQRQLFDRLIVSSNRLSGYINNILNTSRYDQRHLQVHLRETAVATIWDVIADDMQLRAQSQGRLLTVNLPPDLPTVAADINSMSEVLGNLIDNAIKYSNEGGAVEVTAEQSGTSVEIHVIDNGIGMPSNVVSNLFHKFYRSHRSRETVAGTGIGLYISKGIVESHGGTLSVQSAEGHGSTFTVALPVYESVKDKLAASGGDNTQIIKHAGGSWIKNHGSFRG